MQAEFCKDIARETELMIKEVNPISTPSPDEW